MAPGEHANEGGKKGGGVVHSNAAGIGHASIITIWVRWLFMITLCPATNISAVTVLQARPALAQDRGPSTGLPIPRFVSLKASRVNLRKGPGTEYPTAWVFRRAGLPVEVIREYEIWREVRDADGTTGWVIRSLLSSRRTAQILPWEVKPGAPRPRVEIRSASRASARPVVIVEAGVLADIMDCSGDWCRVSVSGYRGFVEQKKLWGVYSGEVVE